MGRKLKFVISDLHVGAGHAESNYLEDFTVDKKLARFLQAIWQESERDRREIELIINGDFFEFLHVPAVDHYDPTERYPIEAYLDSSQQASIKRLNLIVEGHPEVFDALSDFIHVEPPQRRITIIKGNHDVNLYWPGVKSRLREVLGASGSRSSLLLFAEEFVSREKIYVEHGHQRTEQMNSYHDFLDPRLPNDPSQLYYPAGSHFVVDFFNSVRREHWFVDNIKPMTTLIWYALQWDFDFAVKMLLEFIRHTPGLVVSNFATQNVFAVPADEWLQGLANEATRLEWAQRYGTDLSFRQEFHHKVQQYLDDASVVSKDASFFPSLYLTADSQAMGRADQQQQEAALHRAAEEIVRQQGARVVIFGHTHRPVQTILETGAVYVNTGGWLRDLSEASPGTWQALFNGSLCSQDLPLPLPYARIDYDEDHQPSAQLLDFAPEVSPPHPELFEESSTSSREKKSNWLTWRFFSKQ